uniref:Uncharacterized protein n=1 Tax=Pipistrellus kuhlii TaxID=59472 RepID=A0A7J7VC03_PIPKU|nr:hypothetical protein mPipKuh1_008504 [Pipistrellus kuhlii]
MSFPSVSLLRGVGGRKQRDPHSAHYDLGVGGGLTLRSPPRVLELRHQVHMQPCSPQTHTSGTCHSRVTLLRTSQSLAAKPSPILCPALKENLSQRTRCRFKNGGCLPSFLRNKHLRAVCPGHRPLNMKGHIHG